MRKSLLIGLTMVMLAAFGISASFAQNSSTAASSARPWVGMRIIDDSGQVVITQIETGSPAETAGLLVGDIITSFGGAPVASTSDLTSAILAAGVGDTVQVDVLRDGQPVSLDLTLGGLPTTALANQSNTGNLALDPQRAAERLLQAELSIVDTGWNVDSVNTSFNLFGLQVGDVITAINGQNVTDLSASSLQLDLNSTTSPITSIQVLRNGVDTTLQNTMPSGGLGGMDDDSFGEGDDEHFGRGQQHGEFDDEGFGEGEHEDGFGNLAPLTPPQGAPALPFNHL